MALDVVKEKIVKSGGALKKLPRTAVQNFKVLSKRNKIIVSAIAVLLVLVLIIGLILPKGDAKTGIRTAMVHRGNISVVISGTGTIAPIDEYSVTSLVKGEILMDTFQEGDMVEKGDLLYQIDASDLENSLEKAELNLQKSQLSYNQTMDDLDKQNVRSTYGGTITKTYVKVGDMVNNGTKIADLVNQDVMLLELPFNEVDADNIYPGASAQVMLTSSFYNLTGTVRRVSSGSLISAEGARVKTVEIEVQNPGALKPGDMATAIIGNVACNGPGTFEYSLETTIMAETSGEVVSVHCGTGDRVSSGQTVAVLKSSNAESTRLNSQISLRDSQLSIENYHKQLENYQITAPISGTVLKKTSKAGDTLDNSNASVVMAVIADMSTIIFEMNVDELDISKVKVGQKVSVKADALENRVYTGYVDYVSVVGTTQNGVTTYPIKIVVEKPDGLIPGMNVSAEIVVESRENVLRVPVTAVNRGNIVYVKDKKSSGSTVSAEEIAAPEQNGEKRTFDPDSMPRSGAMPKSGEMPQSGETPAKTKTDDAQTTSEESDKNAPKEQTGGQVQQGTKPKNMTMEEIPEMVQKNAPEGFHAVRVETGLNDSDFIEIISGLSEGDEVYVPTSAGSSDNPFAAMMGMGGRMPGGMSGGMPSGMPSGGMSGGGMSGGNRMTGGR